jgi:hypothetical protein
MNFRVTSETRCALEGSIALITRVGDAEMNRFLVLAKILFYVENFIAVIALESWTLVVDHVGLDVSQRVEHFAALIAWDFLLGSMRVVDVIPQSRVAVEAFVAVLTFVFPLAVVNVA